MKYFFIAAALWLIYKYRSDIFGFFVDWIEPKHDDDMTLAHPDLSEDLDYDNIKHFIAHSKNRAFLDTCLVMIEMFQDRHKGFTGIQKASDLCILYEKKEAEIKEQIGLQDTVSIERGF